MPHNEEDFTDMPSVPDVLSDEVSIDFDSLSDEDEAAAPTEIPEYYRIKIPFKDEFMSIACIYDGREEEHIPRGETKVLWLNDKTGQPYKFDSKEEARVFLALNVDPKFIRSTDRPQSIVAYAIKGALNT